MYWPSVFTVSSSSTPWTWTFVVEYPVLPVAVARANLSVCPSKPGLLTNGSGRGALPESHTDGCVLMKPIISSYERNFAIWWLATADGRNTGSADRGISIPAITSETSRIRSPGRIQGHAVCYRVHRGIMLGVRTGCSEDRTWQD